jgi:hypothetical protein
MKTVRFIAAFLILVVFAAAQKSGAVAPSQPKFTLVRSVLGSKGGEQAGRYVIEDPRTTFYLPADTRVIAYFEWDGPLGVHTMEATWKNPTGKVAATSDFKYEAKQKRFAGYWELLLSDSAPTGIWTVEVTADGESAGAASFQVVSAPKPEIKLNTRRLLEPAELYKKISGAHAIVDLMDKNGVVRRTTSGFLIDDGKLATSFQGIDGATSLRVTLSDGSTTGVKSVAGFDRWQDWALLRLDSIPKLAALVRSSTAPAVGDRCVTVNVTEQGAKNLVDAQVTGIQKFPRKGERLSIASSPTLKSIGSPVVDEYGEVVALTSGVAAPGGGMLAVPSGGLIYGAFPANLMNTEFVSLATTAIAISNVQAADEKTLEAMWQSNAFIEPLIPAENIGRATIGKTLRKGSPYPDVSNEQFQYRTSDKSVFVFISWSPRVKQRGMGTMKVYDADNNIVLQSKPNKMNVSPGDSMTATTWEIPLASIKPGLYRVDVFLDTSPIFRSFFKVEN